MTTSNQRITNEILCGETQNAVLIKDRIESIKSSIRAQASELAALEQLSLELDRVTLIHNGVALSVVEDSVSAVSWEIRRWAQIFEDVRDRGTWRIRAHFRGRDRILTDNFKSRDEAMSAACDWIASGAAF